uniref:Myb/SANT-like domain-containing protein n=1 Tax=Glycine max TaxID=3847 RepID=A0A0R0G4A6_SOYBN
MSTIRGKAVVNPSQNIDKEKATWDPKANEAFIEACLEQITKGECLGSSFTKVGTYNKAQLKNKYDNLRKDWRVWYKLFGKETGLGWDNIKNTIDAPNECLYLENPLYEKFRYKGLSFAHQLTILFKDVVVIGDFMWAPSSGILPSSTLGGDVNDVYRLCLDGININMEEGSGDNDDVSVGATNEFGDIANGYCQAN